MHYHLSGVRKYPENVFDVLREFINKTRGLALVNHLDIDAEEAISIHRRIIQSNPLLLSHYKFIYCYFQSIEDTLEGFNLPSLEIGSGGGFLKEFLPSVITSDVVKADGIDRVEDATALSLSESSLKAVYAQGVLHHIHKPARCLEEIQRVLIPGGMFVCSEPSSSSFGYFMNRHFHHEYTNKFVQGWTNQVHNAQRRLSDANMAIPYIIFRRDAVYFQERFPYLKIRSILYFDFLRYTLSGGLSYRPFLPGALARGVDFIETIFRPLMPIVGNNMLVTIQKIGDPSFKDKRRETSEI